MVFLLHLLSLLNLVFQRKLIDAIGDTVLLNGKNYVDPDE